MIPPGLSFISMSEKAWQASESSNLPKFYLNLKSYKKSLGSNSNPYTPAVNLVFALDESLKMMKAEGLKNIFARHNRHKPAITAIKTDAIDAEEFRKEIKNKYDILLAGGQDHLKGKIFRVGHLGYINERDIITVIAAISNVLLDLNKINSQQAGEALKVASKYLAIN